MTIQEQKLLADNKLQSLNKTLKESFSCSQKDLNIAIKKRKLIIGGGFARRLSYIKSGIELKEADFTAFESNDSDIDIFLNRFNVFSTKENKNSVLYPMYPRTSSLLIESMEGFKKVQDNEINSSISTTLHKNTTPIGVMYNTYKLDKIEKLKEKFGIEKHTNVEELDTILFLNNARTIFNLYSEPNNIQFIMIDHRKMVKKIYGIVEMIQDSENYTDAFKKLVTDKFNIRDYGALLLLSFDFNVSMYYITELGDSLEDTTIETLNLTHDSKPYTITSDSDFYMNLNSYRRIKKYKQYGFEFDDSFKENYYKNFSAFNNTKLSFVSNNYY